MNETWIVEQASFKGHTESIEDLQWSPNEDSVRNFVLVTVELIFICVYVTVNLYVKLLQVFASCSVDRTIKFWDVRITRHKACMISVAAHEDDVNVISWNR